MRGNVGDSLIGSIRESFYAAAAFLPNFIAGIIILLIGIIVGSIVKRIVVSVFASLHLEAYLHKYGIPEGKKDYSWANVFSEVARWFVIIIFLIPTADVWGLPQITTVLNTFLLYLPNVFVAAIIGIVGFAFAKLASDVVMGSARGISPDVANLMSSVTRWAITVFVALAVLTQLGVASDLIRILFTGFVAMVALAGGIAFGLGGQDTAKAILETLRRKLK
ncbi:MAG: hypothetical protein AAB478_03285 [Patescibacteria group bacterium]